ncbi:MAG: hypothetical protein AAFZ15_15145 [Bacteroidota bacterium]
MKRLSLLLLFLIAGFIIPSCKKPPSKTKAEVVQERLNDRLKRWKDGVNRNCKKRVMETAVTIVDSTLLANARLKRDTSDIPAIPPRPAKPDFTPPEDSIPVKPILEENN